MQKILLSLLVCLLVFQNMATAQDIILLHTNDLHSKLNGYSPEMEYTPMKQDGDMTRGGFARIAGLIQREKAAHPNDIVLAVDAGDFLMGSLFHPLEKETGFQLKLMKEMGYDYLTLGNHEFDYGPETLAQIINHAKNGSEIPQLILTNVEFDEKDSRDDDLQALFTEGTIKSYAIHEEKGVKIAFLGIIGYDAEEVQPFLPPVIITDPLKAVKKTSRKLIKEDMADLVIVLSHSGVEKEKNGWEGEDVKLARKAAPHIHAIISGHTHTKLTEPVLEKEIPIVQTGSGGRNVGRLILHNTDGSYHLKEHQLIAIDDNIPAIESIQKKIDIQKEIVQNKLLSPLGIKYDDPLFETSFNMECHEVGLLKKSTLGPLLADAIQSYTEDSGHHSDLSLIAAGVIRDQLRKGDEGTQNISDVFRITSLGEGQDDIPGYAIAQIYITAKEMKSVLEVLIMAQESSPAAYCYYSGAKISVDMEKGFLKKVRKIELGSDEKGWTELDFSKKNDTLYAVTANAYMLTFLSMIKQKSFGLVNVRPKDKDGNPVGDMKNQYLDFDPDTEGIQEGKEWLAFRHYVMKFPDVNGNNIPDVPADFETKYNPVILLNE